MNEPVAKLFQKDTLPGPLILNRTDGVISSSMTFFFFKSRTSTLISPQSQLR